MNVVGSRVDGTMSGCVRASPGVKIMSYVVCWIRESGKITYIK